MATYKNLRPRYLIMRDIIDELGGFAVVAQILGKEEGTVRKITEDPERSGREITVPDMITVLGALADRQTDTAQHLVDEILSHFHRPTHRKIMPDIAVARLEEVVNGIKNGDVQYQPTCNCGSPLMETGVFKGERVFSCPACHGARAY